MRKSKNLVFVFFLLKSEREKFYFLSIFFDDESCKNIFLFDLSKLDGRKSETEKLVRYFSVES